MPSTNRLINALLKSLPSLLPKRFSGDGKTRDRKKCHADASIIPAKKLVLRKGRKIGSAKSGDLSYHIILFEACNGEKRCAIQVGNKTQTCLNQITFDMRTAWRITLLLLDVVNENQAGKDNQWTGKGTRKNSYTKEQGDE